ncbi:DUF3869 domain-containing protein [Bacteroides sp. UBA939]|uniref:DUF3869 domain-containing protein n=1 Tax=Bacteroides sp. UBA939 TaxID=1946092 RepID=UPI0025C3AC0F|nr:DUF3869 domain-containing protein [Bacteroides sp. UBA939]
MRKINLLKGLNAKSALAVAIVAGFTLAGCEKEDFNVNVPDIDIPAVVIPPAEDGIAYVVLTATSASGNTLEGVTFKKNGTSDIEAETSYTAPTSFTVTASLDGYSPVVKTVTVPALKKGAYVVIPVSFVLSAVEESTTPDVGAKTNDPAVVDNATETFAADFVPGTEYTRDVKVPFGTYYTAEQKAELLEKVEALTGPVTRAGEEDAANLGLAKQNLRDMINSLPTTPNTELRTISFLVTAPAKSVTFAVITTSDVYDVTLKTTVAGKNYQVSGNQLLVAGNDIKVTAEGVEITHGHGHGHGDDGNAGGGIGGK